MRIAIGSDHAGFSLKEEVLQHLSQKGVEVEDVGCFNLESVDYPDYGRLVAEKIQRGSAQLGIVICGTGIGISIAANKMKGIRAALCQNSYTATMARQHNDANILAMGARVIGSGVALDTVDHFVHTEFEGGRHQRRVSKMMDLENI